MTKAIITGATGFIGSPLTRRLAAEGCYQAVGVVRRESNAMPAGIASVVQDISAETDWRGVLSGVEAVIHTAARAHVLNEPSSDPLGEYRRVNTEGTLNLARQAAAANVRRFVFISSVGVNGTNSIRPFVENDHPNPTEPYAVSKLEAEKGLCQLAEETDLEVVIIRPPLVYGPKAPGNFGRLIRAVDKGFILPLGAIHNKRSLIALDNLIDFILICVEHPEAVNQIFLVSDGEDLSTTELLQRMAYALNKSIRLIPVPTKILALVAALFGKRTLYNRLCGSLQVDISKANKLLGWQPPLDVNTALRKTAEDYMTTCNKSS
jgi:nucleoside-diphosphate-sugar epimerase